MRTANEPITVTHIVEIFVHDLRAIFEFYILPTCQPVLSMGQLRHAQYRFEWSDDLSEGMKIRLPGGDLFETMLQNDAP